MKIVIKEVFKRDDAIHVAFSNKFGTGIGEWRGEIPKVNNEYFVEIEVPQVLTWGNEITLHEEVGNKIFTSEGIVHFIGTFENITEDGLAFIRFDNILIDIEIEGETLPKNSIVKVSVEEFILCEINY